MLLENCARRRTSRGRSSPPPGVVDVPLATGSTGAEPDRLRASPATRCGGTCGGVDVRGNGDRQGAQPGLTSTVSVCPSVWYSLPCSPFATDATTHSPQDVTPASAAAVVESEGRAPADRFRRKSLDRRLDLEGFATSFAATALSTASALASGSPHQARSRMHSSCAYTTAIAASGMRTESYEERYLHDKAGRNGEQSIVPQLQAW